MYFPSRRRKKAGNGDDGNVVEKQRRVSRRRHRFHGAPGRRLPNPPPDRRIPDHPRADMLHEPFRKESGESSLTCRFHGCQHLEDESVEADAFPQGQDDDNDTGKDGEKDDHPGGGSGGKIVGPPPERPLLHFHKQWID